MKLVHDIVQGSEEWHKLRNSKIGASDAPIIMGISPWDTPYSLWQKKLGLKKRQALNEAMKRGNDLEESARNKFIEMIGIEVLPAVGICDDYNFMMASFDGISSDSKTVVEIKCPGKMDHEKALSGVVPEKYIPQLQHQLSVSQLEKIYYFSFNERNNKLIEVYRDDRYILKMIEQEKEFFRLMEELETPPLLDRDYEEIVDIEWDFNASEWLSLNEKIKRLELLREEHRKTLIAMSSNRNCKGAGVKLARFIRRGSIEYKSIPEISSLNIEKYRKEPTEYWKITHE